MSIEKDLPHSGLLNTLAVGLEKALTIITKSPIESLPDLEPETEEKRKKMLFNILPNEESRGGYSEYEVQATSMIRKIGMTPSFKLKHAMFKKMVLKLVYSFYEERAKEMTSKIEFGVYIFDSLMKKYMMKKAAQNRFKHLLSSCVKYKTITRIRVFGRFLGLYDFFDANDLNFYLTTANTLRSNLVGKALSNLDSAEKHFVPYARCVECIKSLSRSLPSSEISEVFHKLEIIKFNDPGNKQLIVEIDEFLEILIEKYHNHKNESYDFVKYIYDAGDVRVI